ncbi:sulfite exporter TauE/SafE family protein [Candidatus Gracilibacteria bacterium]|nr:sulfite exporter TauE/SafE family protein [Candidatus Gracilibacteria bacterium]
MESFFIFVLEQQYSTLFLFILVGFIAQVIDGGIGMGFGLISNIILISMGFPPVVSSASVHTAEVFTTGFSSFFHLRAKNIKKDLFVPLVTTGVIGGVLGAYLLSSLEGKYIKPFIVIYLLIMGIAIIHKALQKMERIEIEKRVFPLGIISKTFLKLVYFRHSSQKVLSKKQLSGLGLVGGFLDSIGGGGWGPVVTSTLVAKNHHPRYSIGSTSAAEFFVTFATSLTFFTVIGLRNWQIIAGLLIGGMIAAPLSAFLCRAIVPRVLMLIIGTLVILLSFVSFHLVLNELFPSFSLFFSNKFS